MAWTRTAVLALPAPVGGVVYGLTVDGLAYLHTAVPGEAAADVASAVAALVGSEAQALAATVRYTPAAPGLSPTVEAVGAGASVSWVDGAIAAELRRYARAAVDVDEAQLVMWLAAACEAGDAVIGADYQALADVPTLARLGCYAYVRVMAEAHDSLDGLSSRKAADVQENWAAPAIAERALRAGESHWRALCVDPLLLRAPQ